ncbi:acyltransferase domain-containing protein [Micromonospora zhanjiangensis]
MHHITHPTFTHHLNQILTHFNPELRTAMTTDDIHQTRHTQPALFAYEVALYHTLGLTPHYLAGHSIGEITAAHLTGTLSLADAAKLVTARATLMQNLPATGAMATIQATVEQVTPHLVGDTTIAAINTNNHITISGTAKHVQATLTNIPAPSRLLQVSHAFHSPTSTPSSTNSPPSPRHSTTRHRPSPSSPTSPDKSLNTILATGRSRHAAPSNGATPCSTSPSRASPPSWRSGRTAPSPHSPAKCSRTRSHYTPATAPTAPTSTQSSPRPGSTATATTQPNPPTTYPTHPRTRSSGTGTGSPRRAAAGTRAPSSIRSSPRSACTPSRTAPSTPGRSAPPATRIRRPRPWPSWCCRRGTNSAARGSGSWTWTRRSLCPGTARCRCR